MVSVRSLRTKWPSALHCPCQDHAEDVGGQYGDWQLQLGVGPTQTQGAVTCEINVGKRRVIEFFLFPVIRYLDEGLKVR